MRLYEEWQEKLTKSSKKTAKEYRYPVIEFLTRYGFPQLDNTTYKRAQDFINECPTYHTAHIARAALQSFFSFCDVNIRLKNPHSKPEKERDDTPLTDAQIEAMLEKCATIEERLLILLIRDVGDRSGGYEGMNRSDYLPEQRAIKISRMNRKNRIASVQPLTDETCATIEQYLASRNDDEPALFRSIRYREGVGNRQSADTIREHLHIIARRAGIFRRVYPHLFRYRKGLMLRNARVEKDVAMNALGIRTPQVYDAIYGKRTMGETLEQVRAVIEDKPQRNNDLERMRLELEIERERARRAEAELELEKLKATKSVVNVAISQQVSK